jgi:hypothetical protein
MFITLSSTLFFLYPFLVNAANDWSTPCSGSCSYESGDGTTTAWGSILIVCTILLACAYTCADLTTLLRTALQRLFRISRRPPDGPSWTATATQQMHKSFGLCAITQMLDVSSYSKEEPKKLSSGSRKRYSPRIADRTHTLTTPSSSALTLHLRVLSMLHLPTTKRSQVTSHSS